MLRLVTLVASLSLAVPGAALACGSSGYSYAGVSSRDHVHGIAATMSALAAPAVQNGHVAGWVGVGGPGLGPNGSDEWIQVGYSGFPGLTAGSLYYEVALPGKAPAYNEVLSSVLPGTQHRLAVLELAGRPDWWRVWVDGRPASRPYHLPGSHGAWPGIATAENWGGGVHACNGYAYRFDDVSLAYGAGGSWRPLSAYTPLHGGGNRLLLSSPSSFVARANP